MNYSAAETAPPHIDGRAVRHWGSARLLVDALRQALRNGLRPADQPARTSFATQSGELLLMPAAVEGYAGVKIVGLAPGNSTLGLPTISGLYLLLDAPTLRPIATLDGAALTALRTAAVSVLAVEHLARRPITTVAVFGSGPQAEAHLELLQSLHDLQQIMVLGRNRATVDRLIDRFGPSGTPIARAQRSDVRRADLVVCCTNSAEPLLSFEDLCPDAIVVAVGSHRPDARELGADVMGRARVVVETRSVAETTAGDVVQAMAAGRLEGADLVELADVVLGQHHGGDGLQVFKSVGMAWEDLAVSAALFERFAAEELRAEDGSGKGER